jgi:hypothetical protein
VLLLLPVQQLFVNQPKGNDMTEPNNTPDIATEVDENELENVAGGIWQGTDTPHRPGEMRTTVMPPDFHTM